MKIMMIVSLSIFNSQEQAPTTIALMIILSQDFDSISDKYFDKKFCRLKRDLVEDAECNSHHVVKRGKQSKKHFSTRSGAAESSYRPLYPSVTSQPRTFRSFKLSQFRGERQDFPGPTDICFACGQQGHWRKFCPAVKWNLGFNNARDSNLQVEYNGNTLNSVTRNQPVVSAEFEQGGSLQTVKGRLKEKF